MEVVQRNTGSTAMTHFGESFRALDETVRKAKTLMIVTHKKGIQIKSRLTQTMEQSRSTASLTNVISVRKNMKETTVLIKEAQETLEEVEEYLVEAQTKLDLGYSKAALSVLEDTTALKSVPKLREMEEEYSRKLDELSEDWKTVTLNITEWNESLRQVHSTSYISWPRVTIVSGVFCFLSVVLIMLSSYFRLVRIVNIIIFVVIYIRISWESLHQISDLQKRTILIPLVLYNLEASFDIIHGVINKRITVAICNKCTYIHGHFASVGADILQERIHLCCSLSQVFTIQVIFGALLCTYYAYVLYINNNKNRSTHETGETIEAYICFLLILALVYAAMFFAITFLEYTIGCSAPRLYTMLIVYVMFTVNNVFREIPRFGIIWFSVCSVPFYVVSEACQSEDGILLNAFALACFNQYCMFVALNVVGIVQFMTKELCDHLSGWIIRNVSKI